MPSFLRKVRESETKTDLNPLTLETLNSFPRSETRVCPPVVPFELAAIGELVMTGVLVLTAGLLGLF